MGDAAYDSLWYESDSRDSRIILLLLMRSQNQLTITIGKVMNLSLERFSGVSLSHICFICYINFSLTLLVFIMKTALFVLNNK